MASMKRPAVGGLRRVNRVNGDHLVILPGHAFPESTLRPENWQVEHEREYGRDTAIVKAGTYRLVARQVSNSPDGNTAFTEARILREMLKRGLRTETPLAVYFRDGFNPWLLTSFVKPDANATNADRARAAIGREIVNRGKGVLIPDDNFYDNVIIQNGKTVKVDVERGSFLDPRGLINLKTEQKLRRKRESKDPYLSAPKRSILEFVEEVRQSLERA